MKTVAPRALPVVLALAAASSASAHDMWEFPTLTSCNDDLRTSCNQLRPGVPQVHDLEGTTDAPDYDWTSLIARARRSYEVDVRGGTLFFENPDTGCAGCPQLARVTATGTVLTPSFLPDGPWPLAGATDHPVVRWITGAVDQREYIRVGGTTALDLTSDDRYEIVLRDTTLTVPRWNSSGTQATVLLVSNRSPHPVTGSVFFYDGAGALRHTEPLSVARDGLQVISTTAIPGLAGLSGSATIAHDGGWGALAGKAVALEPATGFTFDSPMTYQP